MTTDRWAPKEGTRIRFTLDPNAAPDDPPPPCGTWSVLARSPSGPSHWWCLAVDDLARAWVDAHRAETTSGCIDMPNRRMAPANRQRI